MPETKSFRYGFSIDGLSLLILLTLGGSLFLSARSVWLEQNAKYDSGNRLAEPPIVRDMNWDEIDDISLRYLDGREEVYVGYQTKEGRVAYRLLQEGMEIDKGEIDKNF